MTLPFELYIAARYLLARRRQAFISVISAVSALGVTVGVMALVIALALMTGMQEELRDKIVGSAAHVYVQKLLGGGLRRLRGGGREARRGAWRRRGGSGDARARDGCGRRRQRVHHPQGGRSGPRDRPRPADPVWA